MKMDLRWYQRHAVDAVWKHLTEREDNPCVVMPTGSGKSPTIAQIVADATSEPWCGRVLILAHRKELLEQNAEKLQYFAPDLDYGIYSAGLKKRDVTQKVIFAGIQSIYQKGEILGLFNLIIIDEAHLIPHDEGMYTNYLKIAQAINPRVRVIGFTATPYRTKTGRICTKDGILNHICYEAPVIPLVKQGYLTKLISRGGCDKGEILTQGVKKIGGDFSIAELEEVATKEGMVEAAVRELIDLTKKRSKGLIFCTGVAHAALVTDELIAQGAKATMVVGDTPSLYRANSLDAFREGNVKFLVNVGCFTEGLDVPDVDAIILLRPTCSPGLYVQMVGRGFRIAKGKKDCLILDYGGNVMRHGPVDFVTGRKRPTKEGGEAPMKMCPECRALCATGCLVCVECGHTFDPPESTHDTTASDLQVLAKTEYETKWLEVDRVNYSSHTKRDSKPDHPKTLRAEYGVTFWESKPEWVCLEHTAGSFARRKAEGWWWLRNLSSVKLVPNKIEDALNMIESLKAQGLWKEPIEILIQFGRNPKEFDQIIKFKWPEHDPVPLPPRDEIEVPF